MFGLADLGFPGVFLGFFVFGFFFSSIQNIYSVFILAMDLSKEKISKFVKKEDPHFC